MVDYSKWDHFGDSEDEAEQQHSRAMPRVTKLDKPSRVTISSRATGAPEIVLQEPAGASTVPCQLGATTDVHTKSAPGSRVDALDYSKWNKLSQEMEHEEDEEPSHDYYERDWHQDHIRKMQLAEAESANQKSTDSVARAEVKGSEQEITSKWTQNGGIHESFLWSQNAAEIIIRVPIHKDTNAKAVTVQLKPKESGLIVSTGNTVLLSRTLWDDVWGAVNKRPKRLGGEDTTELEEAKEMDWELEDLPETLYRKASDGRLLTRCVLITLHKYINNDMVKTIWWERAFQGGEEPSLDTSKFRENESSSSFKQAWEEAHEAFRAKTREPIELP
mmetsp:Transcript_20011/g.37204  ORF Transcript_20011/g.37204 Transcript_20011/m.37204 type:complete len:332 (-) Transcript_20011:803-1798(-)